MATSLTRPRDGCRRCRACGKLIHYGRPGEPRERTISPIYLLVTFKGKTIRPGRVSYWHMACYDEMLIHTEQDSESLPFHIDQECQP